MKPLARRDFFKCCAAAAASIAILPGYALCYEGPKSRPALLQYYGGRFVFATPDGPGDRLIFYGGFGLPVWNLKRGYVLMNLRTRECVRLRKEYWSDGYGIRRVSVWQDGGYHPGMSWWVDRDFQALREGREQKPKEFLAKDEWLILGRLEYEDA